LIIDWKITGCRLTAPKVFWWAVENGGIYEKGNYNILAKADRVPTHGYFIEKDIRWNGLNGWIVYYIILRALICQLSESSILVYYISLRAICQLSASSTLYQLNGSIGGILYRPSGDMSA